MLLFIEKCVINGETIQQFAMMAQHTSNSPFVYFASGTLTISSSANSGKPCRFYITSGVMAIGCNPGRNTQGCVLRWSARGRGQRQPWPLWSCLCRWSSWRRRPSESPRPRRSSWPPGAYQNPATKITSHCTLSSPSTLFLFYSMWLQNTSKKEH